MIGSALPGSPIASSAPTSTPVERDDRGAQSIVRAACAPRDAGRIGIDHEQRDAVAVAALAVDTRADEQLVGAVAVQHQRLDAIDHSRSPMRLAAHATSLKR